MTRPYVYLFDSDAANLRGRMSQAVEAGLDAAWELRATASRNALLTWIDTDARSSPKRHSIALIEHRAGSADIEQTGFRVVETIRRHEYLWKATRPVIWLDELTSENVRYARAVDADAVIDDAWIDRDPAVTLPRVLAWCAQRSSHPYRTNAPTPEVFSDALPDRAREDRARDERFRRWFGFAPDDLDYKLLWGLAGAVEHQFLDEYCAEQGWVVSRRAARKARERLQQAMRNVREELDRAEPSNAEIARRFLGDPVPAGPDPLAELAWPALAEVRQLRHSPAVLRAAFLESGAVGMLDRFLALVAAAESDGAPGGATTAGRLHLVTAAIERIAADREHTRAEVHGVVHRSCHALSDAFDDWRRFGDSEP